MLKVFICITGSHDWRLVLVAAAVCLAAASITFTLYARIPVGPVWRRWVWLGLTGFVAGVGIWTAHFVGMLAFRTGLPTGYAAGGTIGSLCIAILSAGVGFALASAPGQTRARSIRGGLVVGVGITCMHYVGMSAYRTTGWLHWDMGYVLASIAIGAVLASAALFVGRPGASHLRGAAGAGLLSLSILGMHFTGMSAVTIVPDGSIAVAASLIAAPMLAALVVAGAALIMLTAMAGALFDRLGRDEGLRRLRDAIEVLPQGLAFYDADDRLVVWNAEFAALAGATGLVLRAGLRFSDILDHGLRNGDYLAGLGREAAYRAERLAMRQSHSATLTEQRITGRWLRLAERRTADGGTVFSSVDVTELKAAEFAIAESERRFRQLTTNAPDMITEIGPDGTLNYISPACQQIVGFTPEELVGRNALSLMDQRSAVWIRRQYRAMTEQESAMAPTVLQFPARHKSGRQVWLECKPTPVLDPDGRVVGFNDVVRDVTERKMLEAELRAARVEAESAASAKGEFLATMSHELRTPLTSVIGFAALAAEQADVSEETERYIGRVRDASRALLSVVNDILDFSKLEAGQINFQPQPINPVALARATLDLVTPQASAKNLRLVLDIDEINNDLTIALDPDRLRQVLFNLVGNAVKFTDTGSVTLGLHYDYAICELTMTVTDTGPGIGREKQGCLFKRFSQVDGTITRAKGGTGLGLAICKGIVEAMSGTIGVESAVGVGSRFWFRIPAPLAGRASQEPDHVTDFEQLSGAQILIVDDHAANRELARLFLSAIGVDVVEADGGEEGVRLALQQPFDVILMDMRMPVLDGPGALNQIRAGQGPNVATPILAFTADVDAAQALQLHGIGFQGVISKPVEPNALFAGVLAALADPPGEVKALVFGMSGQ